MDTPESASALTALGQRLRQARRERGMSQEALAAPEFTKSYVSAVERGKARPSLKALDLMSRRLGVPMNELLAAPPPPAGALDLPALEAEFLYELEQARVLINMHRADEAVRRIRALEDAHAAHLSQLSLEARYLLLYTRALAALRAGTPDPARADLTTALRLAQELDDAQAVERVRDLLGVAFYEQDMPHISLEHHTRGLQAIRDGVVTDLHLRLSIYRNLANDLWALNDTAQALAIYQEALPLLNEVNDLDRQAEIYWDLGATHLSAGDLTRARAYASKALAIYEAAQNLSAAAEMRINLGNILIQQQDYDEAEQVLRQAAAALAGRNQPLLESQVYTQLADLALRRGQVAPAAEYAQQSLWLGQAAFQARSTTSPTRANTARVLMSALRVAGQVAEHEGRTAEADKLFQQAIDLVDQIGYGEPAYDIEFTYADVLTARGQHEQAAAHYRAALHHRQGRPAR
jgi:tetratricopeptide (TPR) repeat protein